MYISKIMYIKKGLWGDLFSPNCQLPTLIKGGIMKRLAALALALTISFTSLTTTVSFASYKMEYEAIYTAMYSEMLITLEKDIKETDDAMLRIKQNFFYHLYSIQYEIIKNTIDGQTSPILDELDARCREKLGIKPNGTIQLEKSATGVVNRVNTVVSDAIKDIDAQQDDDKKAEKVKEYTPLFNTILSELDNTVKVLTEMYGYTQTYTGVSTPELSKTNIVLFEQARIDIESKIAAYKIGPGSGIVLTATDKDFDAADLRASIFNEAEEALYTSYLEAIAITSTLEPFMSVASDMQLYDGMQDSTRQLIEKFGKKRKPIFVSASSSAFDDFIADKQMSANPARLKDLLEISENGKLLFYKTGNDNTILDTNTVAQSQQQQVQNTSPNNGQSTGTSQTQATQAATTATTQEPEVKELSAPFFVGTSGNKLFQRSNANKAKRLKNDSTLIEQSNAALNYALLTNVMSDVVLQEKELNSMLFVDIFGNILLEDDTIVVPAIANATIYEPNTKYPMCTKYAYNHYADPWDELLKQAFTDKAQNFKWGFMTDAQQGSITATSGDESFTMYKLTGGKKNWTAKIAKNLNAMNPFAQSSVPPLHLILNYSVDGKQDIVMYKRNNVFTKGAVLERANNAVTLSGVNSKTVSLSTLEPDPDTDEMLVKGNFNALSSNLFEIRALKLADLATEVAKGRDSIAEYKLELATPEDIAAKGMAKILCKIVEPLLTIANKIRGFTQLSDPSTNIFTKWILDYRALISAFAIVATLFLILKLYSSDVGLGMLALATTLFLGTFIIGLDKIVEYTVMGYNNVIGINMPFINDDGAIYRTMGMAEEQRMRRDGATVSSSPNTDNEKSGGSLAITLFKYPREEIPTKLISTDAGLYLEGRSVKLSIEDLFASVSVTDNEILKDAKLSREIVIHKNYDTFAIENYTMYYDILEHLTKQMTTYSEIAQPHPKSVRYSNNTAKRAYMWKSIADSVLVLNYDELDELQISQTIKDKAKDAFPPNDTFRLADIEVKAFQDDTTTVPLIGKLNSLPTVPFNSEYLLSIHQQYDDIPEQYDDNFIKFVNNANLRMKDYLINNYEAIIVMSDETVTKALSLLVLEEYNKCMTSPLTGKWVYPINIDTSNMSLEKILFATVDDLSWYNLSSVGLLDMLVTKSELLGYILLAVALPPMMGTMLLISTLPFLLIVLLMVVLFLRIFMRQELSPIFKGFMRMMLTVSFVGFMFSKTLLTVGNIGWKLFILTILSLISLDILVGVIKTVVSDWYSMGYNTFGATMYDTYSSRVVSKFGGLVSPLTKAGRNDLHKRNSDYISSQTRGNSTATDRVMSNPHTANRLRKYL